MAKILIEIHTGNDAMQTEHDVASALHKLAKDIVYGGFTTYKITDDNGNVVGHMVVKEDV